jgi:hypothetical protein
MLSRRGDAIFRETLDPTHRNPSGKHKPIGLFRLPAARMARTAASGASLMQLSFTLLLCLIDLKAEQKKRDDRVVTYASHPIGARHRTPQPVVSVSDKIA